MTLLTGLARLLPPGNLVALHVNYGLREESDADERLVAGHCSDLGVETVVHRAGRPAGNVQAWAREVRLARAEELRNERDMDWIAVGHTRTDQAETFLYRLASSPGARPLLAMPARSGRTIRPLLAVDRRTIREVAETSGIPFHDDATNASPAFARNRIRLEVMPVLERINPGAEGNIARTRAELEEDEQYLAREAAEILESTYEAGGLPASSVAGLHPAVLRRLLRLMAEDELGRPVAIPPGLAREVRRLAERPQGGSLDLGSGDRLVVESGRITVQGPGGVEAPGPVELVPGDNTFGGWMIRVEEIGADEARDGFGDPLRAFLDASELAGIRIVVRSRREGDRISQLGLAGTKSVQDAFTEGRVPRSERASWPVVTAGDEVLWLPGLAVSDRFLVKDHSARVIRLSAEPPPAP